MALILLELLFVLCGWWAVKTLLFVLSVWVMTLVLCVYLYLCSMCSAWVLAGLAKRNSSSHSYHPSIIFCTVPCFFPFYLVPALSHVLWDLCSFALSIHNRGIFQIFSHCIQPPLFTFSVLSMTTLQNEHYQLWKIAVCLFARFSAPAALNLNLAFAKQSGMWLLLYLYSCYKCSRAIFFREESTGWVCDSLSLPVITPLFYLLQVSRTPQ